MAKKMINVTATNEKLVTIVMPVLNDGHFIANALDAVLGNRFPLENLQILIIDGGSADDTIKVVEEYCRKWSGLFEVVIEEDATVYKALAIALARAKTKYFFRVDARSVIPEGYIEKCIINLEQQGVVGTGGVQEQYGVSGFSRAVAAATSHPFGVGNASFRLGRKSGYVDTVYLGAYRTKDLINVGGFDEEGRFLSEDASINSRLCQTGGKIYLDVRLKVKYPAKDSPFALARQYFIYGAAKAAYVRTYKKFTSWRQIIPIGFLLVIVISAALSPLWPPARNALLLVLVTYLVANFIICLRLVISRKGLIVSNLSMAFAIIHFSWPIGFIVRYLGGEMLLARALRK